MDFYGVVLKKGYKGTANDVISSWSYDEFAQHEKFYARKSWELVHELRCDTQGDCISELTLEAWINLQEKLAPIGPSLDQIWEAYHAELDDRATAHDQYLMKQYEKWYDTNFDEYPTLGYDFSVSYMETFWEAADEVLKYLEDPDWEVWMLASY